MDINNEVRLEVMQMALVLEDMLNRMLMRLFRIKSDDPKTLGHKSSSISFKTKVDFLYDLERIDKPTYTELLTLMEIRNQFLHNLSAESYSIVLSRLGKEKYIEKFAFNIINSEMSDVSTDKEGIYKYGVNTLYLSILVKLRKALETINDEIEEEKTICYTMKYYSLV